MGKRILDEAATFEVVNKIANYDLIEDRLISHESAVTRNQKNGYLLYDIIGRNVGIVFISDDHRKPHGYKRYGKAEILFFLEYKNEFGTWRVISPYIDYKTLENILSKQEKYKFTTAQRYRAP